MENVLEVMLNVEEILQEKEITDATINDVEIEKENEAVQTPRERK